MTRLSLFLAGVVLVMSAGSARAATDCGARIIVSDATSGGTLQLGPTDPILSHACSSGGLTVFNFGVNAVNRSFTVSCASNTITGSGRGVGITLRGPNLTVTGCTVSGFGRGIVAMGDGITIDNCAVANSKGDGIVMMDFLYPLNANFVGSFLSSSSAVANGGWGIKISGNGIDTSPAALSSIVSANGRGGLVATGLLHNINTMVATGNHGPGFKVSGNNCCGSNTLSTVQALANTGPGVVFAGRDDGLNSAALGAGGATLFFPEALDVSGTIVSSLNGACLPKALQAPTLLAQQICASVAGSRCSPAVLARCQF